MTATAVRERGIIFTAESIRAIFDGRKTQTRRVVKPQPSFGGYPQAVRIVAERNGVIGWWKAGGITAKQLVQHSPYHVGDRLWVKEQWMVNLIADRKACRADKVRYRATDTHTSSCGVGWRSPLFMPKWAARLWLEITDVRVQRVQEIMAKDAVAEGVYPPPMRMDDPRIAEAQKWAGGFDNGNCELARVCYRDLWDSINKAKFPWSSNPFVWCISFRRIER